MVTLHKELSASETLKTAGCTVGSLADRQNFEVYLPPNPYHAFSLRVVIDHGDSALFAAKGDPSLFSAPADAALPKEGVGTDSPDDGPEPGL